MCATERVRGECSKFDRVTELGLSTCRATGRVGRYMKKTPAESVRFFTFFTFPLATPADYLKGDGIDV